MQRDYRIGRLKGRFVVTWTEDGKRKRYRLESSTRPDAEREARHLMMTITTPDGGMTVRQVWEAYQEEMGQRRQAGKLAETGRSVLPELGHLAASEITREDCRKYMAHRRQLGKKDSTIRTELSCLRAAIVWAHGAELIPAAPKVEMPPKPLPRERYLTRSEVSALVDGAVDPHIRLAILLMLTTAGRSGAVLELTWDRVDMDRRIINLATGDVGPRKGRAVVPINDTLMAALQEAQEAALSRYVIEWGGRRVKSIRRGFTAALRRSGIDHCTPHDLRRTAGRFMAENGVPIEEIAAYLGHTNPNVTRSTYAQFSPSYLRDAAGSLELNGPRLVHRTRGQTLKSK